MKRLLLFFCALSVGLAGCTHFDEVSSTANPAGTTHIISAVTDDSELSRASFERAEGGYKHSWEADDAISVFPGTNSNACFTLIEGAEGNSGKFSGSVNLGEGEFFAVYPYSKDIVLSVEALTVEYPAVQSWRADKASYDKNSYLMVANGTKESLNFKNATAVVRLSLTGSATITKIELKSIGHETIAGTAEVSFENGEPVVSLSGADDTITLNAAVTLTDEAKHFFVSIPPVALSKGFSVTIYDNAGYAMTKNHTFNRTINRNTVVEMPTFAYVATDKVSDIPVADMLDVVFMADGTAKDISPRGMKVQTFADSELLNTYFDYLQGVHVASFDHAERFVNNTSGSHSTGYYKVDFANDDDFKNRLADGHSWETLVMMDAEAPVVSSDSKWFCAQQSGGVGFAVNKEESGHDFNFSVNLTTSGSSAWVIANSGIVPQRGQWYHVVGVWDKEQKYVSIYVDGEKKDTEAVADGAVFFLNKSSVYHWVCVGGDAANGVAGQGWDGDVAIARIYDKALTDAEVTALYNKSYRDRATLELVKEVSCMKSETVSDGYSYMVKGTGFVSGDILRLRSHSKTYECETKIYPDGASATIPSDFVSGNYNIELVRGTNKQVLAEANLTMSTVPQADMLDVVFNEDGTAYDASGMQSEITYKPASTLWTYPDSNGGYIARFTNPTGSEISSGYYGVPYVATNAFGAKQADGHTLELIVSVDNGDAKQSLFSSHQSGGTAFRFDATNSTVIENVTLTNTVGFSPRVNGGYRDTRNEASTIEFGKFYHFVGVWNQSTGEVVCYMNGKQTNRLTGHTGAFGHANKSARIFIIGGDPTKTDTADAALNGDIAIARIYDKPLSATEATSLYSEAQKSWPRVSSIGQVTDVEYFPMVEVAEGWKYSIYGNGIKAGDTISLESTSSDKVYNCSTTSVEGCATLVIPTGLLSDTYDVVLHRGEDKLKIAVTSFTVNPDAELPHTTKSIAHRGYWYVDGTNNVPHNSIAGLQRAQALEGCYAAEMDVWRTADGVLVINHDASIGGVTIKTANYSDIADMTLSNGEKLPTLELYLNEYLKNTSIRLMIHVKDTACIDDIIAMLREKSILDKADWLISPYADAKSVIEKCKSEAPDMVLFHPNDDVVKTYAELAADGITLNYNSNTVNKDYSCIKRAHEAGVKVLVWNDVDSKASMLKYMGLGADYFNTNRPQLLIELRKKCFIEK